MSDRQQTRTQRVVTNVAIALIAPFLLLAGEVLLGVAKMLDQGWRYFVPTWDGLADYVQIAAMGSLLLGPFYFLPEQIVTENGFIVIWVPVFLIFGVFVPIMIARGEERTGREKVFEFAEVEQNGE